MRPCKAGIHIGPGNVGGGKGDSKAVECRPRRGRRRGWRITSSRFQSLLIGKNALASAANNRLDSPGVDSLAVWIVFGLLIEGLIGFRSPVLLDDSTRRDMFRLAHAHGTLLNLVLIAAAICARLDLIRFGRVTSLGLRAAVVLLPGGFLLGGIWHSKTN